MSEHTTQAADFAQLDYDCRGAGSPLLFLHGLTFDRSTWEPIVDQLAGRFTCVAVDLPGHGGSRGSARDLDEVAHSIHHLLDELRIEPPIVVGHSMGAALAGIYAGHHPVTGLVLVDQAPYIRPFAAMVHQLEPALRSDNFRAAFEPIRQSIGVELLPEPERTSILAGQRIDQDLVLGYWDQLLRVTPDELQARADRGLDATSVPVLAVFGQTIDSPTREHFSATSRRRRSRNGPASGTWFTSWNRSALPAGSRSSPTSAPPPHSDTPNDGRRPEHPRDVRGQLPAADPTVGPRFRTPLPAPSRCCTGGCRARARRPAADAVEVRDHQQRRRTTVARCGRSPEARRA